MAASRYWRRWKWFVRVGPVLLTLLAAPANGFSQAQLPDTVYIWPMGNTAQNTMMSSSRAS